MAAPQSDRARSHPRSTREVFEDHLRRAQAGDVDGDLAANVAEDVVLLIREGEYRGHDGARELARRLERELPGGRFDYPIRMVAGDVAFLEWTGDSETARVRDGCDTFLIRDGRIRVQTIHYTVEPKAPQH